MSGSRGVAAYRWARSNARAGLRGETAALAVAEVRLGRLQISPVGRHLQAAGLDHHEVLVDVFGAGLVQELLDGHLGHGVLALAEVVVPDAALGVGEVQRWPEAVGEGAPDGVVVVDRHGVFDPEVARLRDHVVDVGSNPNSGVCTPTTVSPAAAYFAAHARR